MTIQSTAELMPWIPCGRVDMEYLRGLPEWGCLADAITRLANAKCRQILSHHTTSHCQRKGWSRAAPLTSLADHGLSNPQQWWGKWWIHAWLPATFTKDDNLSMDYWGPYSDGAPSGKEASEMACKGILMLLLTIAPNHVQLAPGSLQPGAIPEIRELAQQLHEQLHQQVGWEGLTNRAINAMQERGLSNAGVTSHGATAARPALVIVPGETDEDREARCIVALQSLTQGTEYWGQGLPHRVWTVLAENLPHGGLRPLLLQHPNIFQVDGDPAHWSFQVRITAGVQP